MKILQVGVGNFGKNHLRVLRELGHDVYVVDLSEKALAVCDVYSIPAERRSINYHDFLHQVDAVDVVVPADKRNPVVSDAIIAGKPTFVEKPISYSLEEAINFSKLVRDRDGILQVGHLFRFNPATRYIEDRIKDGSLGEIRIMKGMFFGFKRTRSDVGVLLTDGIHYIDLANMFFGRYPSYVYCEKRDHFGRGMEDVAFLLMDYNPGLAYIEVGNIQPGKCRDITVIGSEATIISDAEGQKVELRKTRHEYSGSMWVPVEGESIRPFLINVEPLKAELKYFVDSIESSRKPEMDVVAATNIVKIVDTAYRSCAEDKKLRFVPFSLEDL